MASATTVLIACGQIITLLAVRLSIVVGLYVIL